MSEHRNKLAGIVDAAVDTLTERLCALIDAGEWGTSKEVAEKEACAIIERTLTVVVDEFDTGPICENCGDFNASTDWELYEGTALCHTCVNELHADKPVPQEWEFDNLD
jgi:hypothetical protein